jgi:hypothetical protein
MQQMCPDMATSSEQLTVRQQGNQFGKQRASVDYTQLTVHVYKIQIQVSYQAEQI